MSTVDITLPTETTRKWQGAVDLIAEIVKVPAALIMRVKPPEVEVFLTSQTDSNPYERGETRFLNTGLYCERVVQTGHRLFVPDARKDSAWKSNPDLNRGMVSYLGFPIVLPNQEIFGTICILDRKGIPNNPLYEKLMLEFRELIEDDLSFLFMRQKEKQDSQKLLAEADRSRRALLNILEDQKQAEEALSKANMRLQMLQGVTAAIHTTLDLEKVFRRITDGIVHSLGYTTALIMTRKNHQNVFQVKVISTKQVLPKIDRVLGYPLRDFSFPADPALNHAMKSAMRGEVTVAKTLAEIAYPLIGKKTCSALQQLRRTRNYILVPLKVRKKVVGGILISSLREEVSDEELEMLKTYAGAAAQAIENASLHLETKRTQEALRQSEERLRTIIGNLKEIVYMITVEEDPLAGRTLFVSDQVEDIIGYRPEEFLENPGLWLRIIHPDDIRSLRQSTQKILASQEAGIREYRIRQKNTKEYRWMEDKVVPQIDDRGKVIAHYGVARDITERKQAEEALRQSEEKHRSILENMEDGYFEVDIEGNLTFFNHSLSRILGYSEDELANINYKEYTDSENAEKVGKTFNMVFRTGKAAKGFDWEIIRKDGIKRVVESTVSLITNSDGQASGFRGIVRDVTERTRAGEEIRTWQERYEKVVAATSQIVYEWDLKTKQTVWGGSLRNVLGYTQNEFTSEHHHWKSRIHPDDYKRVVRAVKKALKSSSSLEVEYRFRHKDGTYRYMLDRAFIVRDPNGKAIRSLGSLVDITQRKRAEEALQQSEQKFRNVIERSNEGIYILQGDRFVLVNPKFAQITGYTIREITAEGFNFRQLLAPGGHKVFEERKAMLRRRETPPDRYQFKGVRKNGTEIDLEVSVTTVEYEGEKATLGILTDITQRKRNEEAILLLSAFPEENPHPVFRTDLEGRVQYSNPAAWKIMEEMRAKDKPIAWLLPRDRKQIIAKIRSQNKVMAHAQYHRKDRVFSSEIHVPKDGDSAHIYLTDITERIRQEETSKRLFTAVEQTAESIIITNPNGAIQYVNPAFEKISGYSPEEAIGQSIQNFKSGMRDREVYHELWNKLKGGEVWSGRITNEKKCGTQYEEETTISPVRDASGKTVNYVFVCRDVTQEVSLEEQLRQAQKLEGIGQLAGGIAHDFNNIITGIIGFAELSLRALTGSHPVSEYLEIIIKKSDQAAQLIRQLLAFSRRQILNVNRVNLNSIVFEATKFLQRIIGEDVELSTLLAQNLNMMEADPSAMEQIITNLCVNARDAMPDGGQLQLRTENVTLDEAYCQSNAEATPGNYVRLSVSDTGVGIESELQQHIFEPFFTTKESGRGTGLGLSMVYGLVKQHNGFIECISELGKGTTFRIHFPVLAPESDKLEEAVAEETKGGHEAILVVEDDHDVLSALKSMIEKYGYTVLTAENGSDALTVYKDNWGSIDLIITDIIMPKMGGMELYHAIQQMNPDEKFLFVSGYAGHNVREKYPPSGDFPHKPTAKLLQKPFSSAEIAKEIRNLLDQ